MSSCITFEKRQGREEWVVLVLVLVVGEKDAQVGVGVKEDSWCIGTSYWSRSEGESE